jgi:hypothetical protein
VDIGSGGTVAGESAEACLQAPGDADGEPAIMASTEDAATLPARPVSQCRALQKIRRMDDPEILERVLAGLLSLP